MSPGQALIGKTLENLRKTYGNPTEAYGNPTEAYGNPMEDARKSYGRFRIN